jgi:hypothetical protein
MSLNNNIERIIQLQQEILNTTIALWEQYPGKTKQENLALYRRLQQQVASIVQNTNGVVAAIHDVPYVQLLPFIVKVAKQANRRVIVLHSTRNASEWVASRAKNHASTVDVILSTQQQRQYGVCLGFCKKMHARL